jgi:hypothetical protein
MHNLYIDNWSNQIIMGKLCDVGGIKRAWGMGHGRKAREENAVWSAEESMHACEGKLKYLKGPKQDFTKRITNVKSNSWIHVTSTQTNLKTLNTISYSF